MVSIYLDSASHVDIQEYGGRVSGFTTNPSLMSQSGVPDYKAFVSHMLYMVKDKPVSFEVFANDMKGMEFQARKLASWGDNIYVKIPATNTNGESTGSLIRKLSGEGIKLNVTAVLTFDQINNLCRCLSGPAIFSIFCGRIADTGRDPVPFITRALTVKHADTQVLWASAREVLNVKQAEMAGADIITLSPSLIDKLPLLGKDLAQYSLETVQQFHRDAEGLSI